MSLKLLLLGFIAGFLATLIFHQGLWYAFNQIGVIPTDRSAWPTNPIPPFDVPSVLSMAFWGGLWGLALTPALASLQGASYWVAWVVIGAVALTTVAFFLVPAVKSQPLPPLWPRYLVGLTLNGAWGFGTALLLRLLSAIR